MRRELGRFVVVDSEICHGQPTFAGTRVMVWNVMEQLADDMTPEEIVPEWRGRVSTDAIAEAVELAHAGVLARNGTGL